MDLEAPTATGQGGARTSGVTSRLVAVSGQATNATRLNPRWELNDPITRQNMEKVGFRHRLFLWKPIVGSGQRGAADVNATGISPSLDCCGLPGLSAGPVVRDSEHSVAFQVPSFSTEGGMDFWSALVQGLPTALLSAIEICSVGLSWPGFLPMPHWVVDKHRPLVPVRCRSGHEPPSPGRRGRAPRGPGGPSWS